LFFQFAGGSEGGLEPGGDWRCLSLGGMTDVSIHDGAWHSRAHSQPQNCVEQVDLEVDP
jgi:hypothetical protein